MALFGNRGNRSPALGIPMPGPITGFGGGTFNMDGSVATPVQRRDDWSTMPQSAPSQMPTPEQRPDGLFDALGNLGQRMMVAQASLNGDFGTSAQLMDLHQRQVERAAKKDSEAEQARQMLASLKSVGLTDEQAMLVLNNAANIGDFRQKAATPYRFEDNAGNVWERDEATGENRLIFTDRAQRSLMGADGQLITIPNPYLTAPPMSGPKPGDIIDDPRKAGGAGPQAPRPFRPKFLP